MVRMLSVAALLGFVVMFASAQDKKDAPSEKLLLGNWKLAKSDNDLPPGLSAVLTIEKDGKLGMKIEFGGQSISQGGKWKLDGKKLEVEFTDGDQKGKKETMEIATLTEKELVTIDEKKKKDTFERVKAAK